MIFILSYLNSFFFKFVIIKSLPIIFPILFSTIIGIILSFYNPNILEFNTVIYVILFCSTSILMTALIWHTQRILFSFILFVNFIFVGLLAGQFKNSTGADSYFSKSKSKYLIIKIKTPPIEKANSFQVVSEIIQNEKDVLSGQILTYLKKNKKVDELEYGDIIKIRPLFNPVVPNGNPYEFNYNRYLRIHDIHHQTFLKTNEWELLKKGNWSFYRFILKIRSNLDNLISQSILSEQNQKLAKALFLGEKEHLDKETLQSFSSAGAMHVLAVSGLHVGIIMLILQFLLKPIKRLKFGLQFYTALVICGVWIYALITGFSPSVIRAALMFSFIVFGAGLQRDISVYQSIAVSAFLILIFDPFSLFKVGFQLSYLAVIGIVYIQPKLYKVIYINNKIGDYLWQITSVSIAAQIATFPLGLYYFHQFPNLFLISNIIVIPLAGLLLSIGFMYFAIQFIPLLKHFFEVLLDHIFSFLNYFVIKIESIPYSIIWGISIRWQEAIIFYFIIVSILFSLTLRKKLLIYLSLSLTILLLLTQLVEQHHIRQTKELTIYNMKKDLAIDIFNGQQNTFICSPGLLNNESKLLFHVKHYWYYKKGNKLPEKIISEHYSNKVLNFNGQTILLLSNATLPIPLTNYVLVLKSSFIPRHVIEKWHDKKTVIIIHPDLSHKVKRYLRSVFPESQIHALEDKGAFQVSYK